MIINKIWQIFKDLYLVRQTKDKAQYAKKQIPSFGDLKEQYNQKWAKEKQDFQTQLKANFLI